MKVEIKDNQLQVICENEQEKKLYDDWLMHNLRQYRHNDNSRLVCGLDINAINLVESAKPAFRVYFDKNGYPGVVTRFSNGTYSHSNTDDSCCWVTDWIEYNPK